MNRYNLTLKSAFNKDFKKLSSKIQEEVYLLVEKLATKEIEGEMLKGNWKEFLCYHFHRKPEYRLIYIVYKCNEHNTCKFDLNHDFDLSQCLGLMELALIATREEMNSLYNKRKKEIENMKRE